MNFNKASLFVLFLFIVFVSCNETVKEKEEGTEQTEEISEKIIINGNWLQILASKEPLSVKQLEEVAPASLKNLPKVKSNEVPSQGATSILVTYSNDKDPDLNSTKIELGIIDGAGERGFQHINGVNNMMRFPSNKEEGDNILKIFHRNEQKILVRQRRIKEKLISEIEFIKDGRYHIKIFARNFSADELYEVLDSVEKIKFPK
ncbi:MAG: hypothetical protein WDZ45_07155 [Flavobacteriaceae bacterium]